MFAGGVTTAGQQLRVNFYNTSNTLVNFFTVNLQLGGSNQIWTITLGITSDGSDSIFEIPSAGRVEIVAQGGATGRFWLTTTAPTIGSNDISWGGVPDSHYHVFGMRAVEVPAP